jgi:hypothetical protein
MPDPLAALEARGDPARAAGMAAYHKASRRYLGVPAAEVYTLADAWRAERSVAERVGLAARLWDSNVHEARMAAARLLTQARIREDEPRVWAEFLRWVPGFDGWALADHACKAGERRLVHDPDRLDVVETWVAAPSLWTRRAALVVTLPWTKLTHPTAAERAERAERERILGMGRRQRSRQGLVHPEGHRLVAAIAGQARSGSGAVLSRRAWRRDARLRPARGRAGAAAGGQMRPAALRDRQPWLTRR